MTSTKTVIVKALSYKLLTTVFLVSVAYWRTGNVKTALMFGIGDAVAKMVLYSIHEGLWARVLRTKQPHVMLEHVTLDALKTHIATLPEEKRALLRTVIF